ncbi:MAG: hypothetical protein EDM05_67435 [Leptolyngbya sp. IPPAS B-1204]|nr:hypothetical protein [Elainella sp. C42_A2020_010]RNJ65570.1 MAG: hypothetical protein EDM05_30515 [Leptolyngbya sp. IPPAS B-1204]
MFDSSTGSQMPHNAIEAIPTPAVSNRLKTARGGKFYLGLWLLANALLWTGCLLYIKYKPVSYTSKWAINVPLSAASTSNVTLPGIGQASSWSDSAYKGFSDPRENYRFLIRSDDLLRVAAEQMGMTLAQFGKPKVRILDNSTIMQFEVNGATPELAQRKAETLQTTLETRLAALRQLEVAQQDQNLEIALGSDAQKLATAQQALTDYKARAALRSSDQLRDITSNLEGLRRERAQLVAQLQRDNAQVRQLAANLNLSSQQAADALALQSDQLFQQYLANYSQVSAELTSMSARFLPASPSVDAKQREKDEVQAALLTQARAVLGRPISLSAIERLVLTGGGSSSSASQRADLFQQLISLQTQQQGTQAQAQELDQQITQLEAQIARLSEQEETLNSLERNVKIAEATFSGNKTRLSLNRTDTSISYPPTTLLTPPNLPEDPRIPLSSVAALLGAALGSVFLTTGMVTLWRHNRNPGS